MARLGFEFFAVVVARLREIFYNLRFMERDWRKRGIQRSLDSLLSSSQRCYFFFLSSNNRQRNFQICFYFLAEELGKKRRNYGILFIWLGIHFLGLIYSQLDAFVLKLINLDLNVRVNGKLYTLWPQSHLKIYMWSSRK